MKSLAKKIFISVCAVILAAAVATGVALLFGANGTGDSIGFGTAGADGMEATTMADHDAVVGDSDYDSFSEAWNAAKGTNSGNQGTVVLQRNVALSSPVTLSSGEYVTLDLNGYSIDLSVSGTFATVNGNFTLIDSTATQGRYNGSLDVGVHADGTGFITVYDAESSGGANARYYYKSGAIYGGSGTDDGTTAIYVSGTKSAFNMSGGSIVDCSYYGGVINTKSYAQLNITDGSISGNTASKSGGAIWIASATGVDGGIFASNYAATSGGAIYTTSGGTFSNATFSGNSANLDGGAVSCVGSSLSMVSCEVCFNTTVDTSDSDGSGGGVCVTYASFSATDCSFHDNVATGSGIGGGAIANVPVNAGSAALTLTGCVFRSNATSGQGGAVYYCSSSSGGSFILDGGTCFYDNEAGEGGAIYALSGGSTKMDITSDGVIFSGNFAATNGGAIYANCTGTISGAAFADNVAGESGGALYISAGTLDISSSTFTGNYANGESAAGGGAIFTSSSTAVFTLSDSTLTDNHASYGGGAIYIRNGSGTLSDTVVEDNTAGRFGGGVWDATNFYISGLVVIQDNYVGSTPENLYIPQNLKIGLVGGLVDGSYIGFTLMYEGQTQLTATESGTAYYNRALRYFHFDTPIEGRYLYYGSKCVAIGSGTYVARSEKPSSSASSFYVASYFNNASLFNSARSTSEDDIGTVTMLVSVDVPSYTISNGAFYTLDAGYYLTLDLNGCNINLSSSAPRLFSVSGTLNIIDSTGRTEYLGTSGSVGITQNSYGAYVTTYRMTDVATGEVGYYSYSSGAITGSYSDVKNTNYYGAIMVGGGGVLNMYGGTVCGNTAILGSAIYLHGSMSSSTSYMAQFNMYGGSVSGNTGYGSVYAKNSLVRLYGGVVSSNFGDDVGAVAVELGSTCYIAGSDVPMVISDNSSNYSIISVGRDFESDSSQGGAFLYFEGGNIEFNEVGQYGVIYVTDDQSGVEISGGYIANNTLAGTGAAVAALYAGYVRMSGGTIHNNTNTGTGKWAAGAVYVEGTEFTMTGGVISGNTSSGYAGAFLVCNASLTITGGEISGNTSLYGAVYVDAGTMKMGGGSISGNTATGNGYGGVYLVNSSAFTMSGGEISSNYGGWGGGVGVYSSSTFEMTGGEIHDNDSGQYAGGVTVSSSAFTMSGGKIYANTSEDDGGVCVMDSTAVFVMYGGEIYGNTATASYGGGVTVGSGATFTLYDGEIYSNTAATYGGGVAVLGSCTFNFYGGRIYSNTAATNGGGVCANSGATLTITGGSVYGNTAKAGAGIYSGTSAKVTGGEIYDNVASSHAGGFYAGGDVNMSGTVVIRGNTALGGESNLYLDTGVYVVFTGNLSDGSYIGVSLSASNRVQISKAETSTSYYTVSYRYFYLDAPQGEDYYIGYNSTDSFIQILVHVYSFQVDKNGESVGYEDFSEALSAAVSTSESSQGIVTLLGDAVMEDYDFGSYSWFELGEGEYLTVDLNGHNIVLSSSSYRAFRVYGTLTLTDSTGYYAVYTGSLDAGVYQNDDGTFTTIYEVTDEDTLVATTYSYTSGAIYGGSSETNDSAHYGAIHVGASGTLSIYGGTITGNSFVCAGGIYVNGGSTSETAANFFMYGGSVSGNTTSRNASAIHLQNTYAEIHGGVISSDTVTGTRYGGSLFVNSGTELFVYEDTGNPTVFSHNSAYYGGGIEVNGSACCEIFGGHFEFNSVTNGGAIYVMSGDVYIYGGYYANSSASDNGGAIYSRGPIYMYGGTIRDNVSTNSGSYGSGAVYLYSGGRFYMYGGVVTSNKATGGHGGGLTAGGGSEFHFYGGTFSQNTAKTNGGGVFIEKNGAVYIEGGYIDGNSADLGGGVYNNGGSLYLYSGGIIGNTSSDHGGGVYVASGSFLMTDGCLYDNYAATNGGGIYSYGTVTIEGGFISYNVSAAEGGGVYSRGTLVMTAGTVSYNTANGNWGGTVVVNYGSTFEMSGGEIIFNTVKTYGGGVYLGRASTFTMTGGEIRENTASKDAGGIFNESKALNSGDGALSYIELSGKVVIRDNYVGSKKNNIAFVSGEYITLIGDLESGSYVGITLDSTSRVQLTTAETDTEYFKTSYKYFYLDDDSLTSYVVAYDEEGRYVILFNMDNLVARVDNADGTYDYYTSYKDALDAASSTSASTAGTVVLTTSVFYDDVYPDGSDYGYVVGDATYLNIDLAGNSIVLSEKNALAFSVTGGHLSLYDSTGYYDAYYGNLSEGVYDNLDGTFTTIYKKSDVGTYETSLYSYTSGAITGACSTSDTAYAGVYVESGSFEMYGGSIVSNTFRRGGAVTVGSGDEGSAGQAVFTMYGGSVSGNSSAGATESSGGVFADCGDADIYGGIISGNAGGALGGGVVALDRSDIYIGAPDASKTSLVGVSPVISGNTGAGGAGIYYSSSDGFSLVINGANIEYNISVGTGSAGNGGGLYVYGTAEIECAFVAYNETASNGAGIFANGDVVVADSVVAYNTASVSGGGIYVYGGTVDVSEGKISYNISNSTGYGGGGIYVAGGASARITDTDMFSNATSGYGGGAYMNVNSALYVQNSVVSSNTAERDGGGVYDLGTLSIAGDVVVRGNKVGSAENNVLLSAANFIELSESLTSGADIGVSFADDGQMQITTQESVTTRYKASYSYFYLDGGQDKYVVYYSGNRYVQRMTLEGMAASVTGANGGIDYYTDIDTAFAAALSTDPDDIRTITLLDNVTASGTLTVGDGQYVVLDFNGKTLESAYSSDSVIKVSGYMVLCDGTEKYEFDITYGGNAKVEANSDGSFTTYYATVADEETGEVQWNSYTSGGVTGYTGTTSSTGAIYVSAGGRLDMYGGTVTKNTGRTTLGIYAHGTTDDRAGLYMYGGSISGNTATESGSQVAVSVYCGDAYIYSGIFAAAETYSSSAVIDVNKYGYIALGTDDGEALSYLLETNPDAYRAGVVVSGNATGGSGSGNESLILLESTDPSFAMYDRVEISLNTHLSKNWGMISAQGEMNFYGGKISWNDVSGAGLFTWSSAGSVAFYGDFVLENNKAGAGGDTPSNLNTDAAGLASAVHIDPGFTGLVRFTVTITDNAPVSVGTVYTRDILSHVVSDMGYCVGLNETSNLYFYTEHSFVDYSIVLENGNLVLYESCSHCGEATALSTGLEYSLSFDIDSSTGKVKVVVSDASGNELCSTELEGGYIVTSTADDGTETVMWYASIDEAVASLESGDTLTICQNVTGDVEISTPGVTVDLKGGSILGSLTISGDRTSVEFNGGSVTDDLILSGCGASVDLGGGKVGGDVVVESTDVELDLNGGTIFGGLTVNGTSSQASLKVIDSTDGDDGNAVGTGRIAGEISVVGGSTLSLYAGTYGDTEDAANYAVLATGGNVQNAALLYNDGMESVTITSFTAVSEYAEASVTYVSGGATYTCYFESLADAVAYASENLDLTGGVVTLCGDVSCEQVIEITSSVTIDLDGHNLDADFCLSAGAGGSDVGVSLTVKDSSTGESGKGTYNGVVTVVGTSSDTEEGENNSYAGTLCISSDVLGKVTADLSNLSSSADENVQYSFVPSEDGASYVISTSHKHVYNVMEFEINSDGTIAVRLRCVCGEYVAAGEDEAAGENGEKLFDGVISSFTYDEQTGEVTYVVTIETANPDYDPEDEESQNNPKNVTVTGEMSVTPSVMISYTDEDGESHTLFFEDASEGMREVLSEILADPDDTDVTMTLLGDVEDFDLVVSDGDLTLNLNGYDFAGDIDVSDGASLKITDEPASIVDSESEGYPGSTKTAVGGDGGAVDGTVTGENVSVSGGSFTDESMVGYAEDGFVAVYEDGKFIFMSEDDANEISAAYIVDPYTGAKTYFTSLSDAISYASDGDTVYIAAAISDEGDAADGGVSIFDKDITIDLNGNTLECDIFVDKSASLTIKDSLGDALLIGAITSEGDVAVTSGSYTADVGEYVASGKTVVASYTCTNDGEYVNIYTVVDKNDSSIASAVASISYEDDGGDIVTVYYDSLEGALAALKDGDTLTLLSEIDLGKCCLDEVKFDVGGDVTLDLNGKTLTADLTVAAGTSLTIIDSSVGKSAFDTEYSTGTGAVVGSVTVETGAEGVSSGALTIEGGTYTDADIIDYVDYASGYTVFIDTSSGEACKNSYTYSVVSEKDAAEKAEACVAYNDGEKDVTIYFDDASAALAWAQGVSKSVDGNGEARKVTITLYDDLGDSCGVVKIESGTDITIDLNGHAIDGDIEIENDASLEITGKGSVNGSVTIDDATGNASAGSFTADGGTYAGSKNCFEKLSDALSDGKVIFVTTGECGALYEVLDEDEAKDRAQASVTVVDGDGKSVTTYFDDIEDALAFLEIAMSTASEQDGVSYTLALWDDVVVDELEGCYGSDALTLDGDFEFDLNGRNIVGDVVITDGSDIGFDLGGGTIDGDVTIGDGSTVDMDLDGGTISGDVTIGDDSTIDMDLDGGTVGGDINIGNGSSLELDLDGGVVEGDINVGDCNCDPPCEDAGSSLTITDSSADYESGDAGSGYVGGDIIDNNKEYNDISVSGGTFGGENTDLDGYIASDSSGETELGVMVGEGGTAVVVPADDISDFSEAYVKVGEEATYYESLEDAIKAAMAAAAADPDATVVVVLTSNVVLERAIVIDGDVTIDLAGHDLFADFVVYADSECGAGEGGSLKISNSTEGEEGGSIAGSVAVVGEVCAESRSSDSYSGTFVVDAGVDVSSLSVDVSSLNCGVTDGAYVFAASDETAGTDSGYSIKYEEGHVHDFTVAVWTRNEDGSVTVTFVCACGEAGDETSGGQKIDACDLEYVDNGDGTYTVTGTAYDENGNAIAEYEHTSEIVASVETEDGTYYFDSVQDAIDFVEKNLGSDVYGDDLAVTLEKDVDESIEVSGKVTLDTNGFNFDGEIEIKSGGDLTIDGDGCVGADIDVGAAGKLDIQGGTYKGDVSVNTYGDLTVEGGSFNGDNIGTAAGNVLYEEGYFVYVTDGGENIVSNDKSLVEDAEAAVTGSDGSVTYYEDLDDALASLSDGDTIVLLDDVDEGESFVISDEKSVTIDLNGHDVDTTIDVEGGASVTITGDGNVGGVAVDKDDEPCSSLIIEGGTYEDWDTVSAYIGEDVVVFVDSDYNYTVTDSDTAAGMAEAKTEAVGGENGYSGEIYFENLQDAVDYVEAMAGDSAYGDGTGKVTMTGDSKGDVYVDSDMEFDFAGYTLDGDMIIADGVEITVEDSSEHRDSDGNLTEEGTGGMSGSIVGGEETCVDVESGTIGGSVRAGDGSSVSVENGAVGGDIETGENSSVSIGGYGEDNETSYSGSVGGDISTGSDSSVDVENSTVGGGISADGDSSVSVTGSDVGGNVCVGDDESDSDQNSSEIKITDSTIGGNVSAGAGSVVDIDGSDIGYGVSAGDGSSVDIEGSDIGGSVSAGSDSSVGMKDSAVEGSVSAGNDSEIYVESSEIGKDVKVGSDTSACECDSTGVEIKDSTVGGSVSSGDGTYVDVEDSDVRGSVSAGDGSSVNVEDSAVDGSVSAGDDSEIYVENSEIGKDVKVGSDTDSDDGASTGIQIADSAIGGDISSGDGTQINVDGSVVGGDIGTGNGSEVDISSSTVEGSISTGNGHDDDEESVDGSEVSVDGSVVGGSISTGNGSETDRSSVDVSDSSVGEGIVTGDYSDVSLSDGAVVEDGGVTTGNNSKVDILGASDENADDDVGDTTVNGGVATGTGSELNVSDGVVNGDVDLGEGSEANVTGGSFTDDGVLENLTEGYVGVVTESGVVVMTEEDAESFADAYVEVIILDENGDPVIDETTGLAKTEKKYFENIEDAIEYVNENGGGKIVLNKDVSCDATLEIFEGIEIDLNGHTLDADILIHADKYVEGEEEGEGEALYGEGGSLTVTDSSATKDEDGNVEEKGTGSITGSIAVEGAGDAEYDEETGSYDNPYENTLTFTDGVQPKDVDIDLGELGTDESEYTLEYDEESGSFSIGADTHVHAWVMEIWALDENGEMTLTFKCSCGETYSEIFTATSVEVTTDATAGTKTYCYTVEISDNTDGLNGTYTTTLVYDIVASVTVGEGCEEQTLYFENAQDALDYVAENGGKITFTEDIEGNLEIGENVDVVIDLGGHSFTGFVSVPEGSSLTIIGSDDDEEGKVTITSANIQGDLTLENVDVTLEGDLAVEGTFGIAGEVDIDLGGNTLTGTPEIAENGSLAISGGEGSEFVLGDDLVLRENTSLTVGGDTVFNLDGNSMEGCESGESFAGSFALNDNASIEFGGGEMSGDISIGDGANVTIDIGSGTYAGNISGEGSVTVNVGEDGSMTGDVEVSGNADYNVDGGKVEGDVSACGDIVVNVTGGGSFEGGISSGADVDILVDGENSTLSGDISAQEDARINVTEGGAIVCDSDSCKDISVGESAEINVDGGSIEGRIDVLGDADISVTDGGSITGDTKVGGDASISVDGENSALSGDVSVGNDADISVTDGGSIVCDSDANEGISVGGIANVTVDGENSSIEADIAVTSDGDIEIKNGGSITGDTEIGGDASISVDGDGSALSGDVSIEGDADIGVTDGGTIVCDSDASEGISVGGMANVTVDGENSSIEADMTFSDDADVTIDGGSISGDMTFTENAKIDVGGGTISGGMAFGGETELDLNGGNVLATDENTICVGDGASLVVTDSSSQGSGSIEGTVIVSPGAELELHDDSYDEENLTVTVGCCYVLVAAPESDGSVYYTVVSKEEHGENHGYDKITSVTFDASTAKITVGYECLCGATGTFDIKLSQSDYTVSVEYVEGGEGDDNTYGVVTVTFDDFFYEEAPNKVVYEIYATTKTCDFDGYTISDKFLVAPESIDTTYEYTDNNYTFVRVDATCSSEGSDTYTYGNGAGIVIVITTPIHHSAITDTGYTIDGKTIYYCATCGRYYVGGTEISVDYGYTGSALASEGSDYEKYREAYSESMDELSELLESLIDAGVSEDDDRYGAYDAYTEAIEALGQLEYEFLGEGSDVLENLLEKIEEIFSEAELQMKKAGQAIASESELGDIYAELEKILDSLDVSDEERQGVKEEFESILSDLANVYVDSVDDIEETYTAFVEKATQDLYNSFQKSVVSTSESAEEGSFSGSIKIEGGSVGGAVELVILEVENEGYITTLIENGSLIYMDGDLSDDEILSLVYGKGVVAIFDIYLRDSFTNAKVYVYSGTYIISVVLPEEMAGIEGLQVLYVGDDGNIEVYDTYITEDGTLMFTTTHFSNYVLIGFVDNDIIGSAGTAGEGSGDSGSGSETDEGTGTGADEEEKETNLMPAIISLSVVDGVLLILGVILLVILLIKKGVVGKGKSSKAVSVAFLLPLLAVVPAGGIAITVVLGVLALAFLAADIYLVYAVLTCGSAIEIIDSSASSDGASSPENDIDTSSDSSADDSSEDGTKN